MAWRLAQALIDLRNEVNTRWPHRDKRSDGTIGDAAHASRASDHNPWVKDAAGVGVVRALDIDIDGIDAAWLAEHLRQHGQRGDRRLTNGGYVIFNRRITNPNFSGWHAYTGRNPHTSHVHVSFSRTAYDDRGSWGVLGGGGEGPAPAPSGRPTLRAGSTGQAVRDLQAFLNRVYPAYSRLAVDGIFGPNTTAAVKEFQRRSGLAVDGIVGPRTWAKLGFR
ncbi:Putative peptidoglycan binding domain-containing protein [Amycolatopsis arida]|uniref:Putative peptidoglycan binding domain-containing protein n=1 Tax=Amycolatopsis arida TaxID=587909 RepID=A0A1I5KBP6_9PSEU|nr:peptidoglycan-binding domain-containing protein [Amycolatopsis arida]TDX96960.1 putative peptidoglycan binding protein [Amycolatopsis arida]SFO82006.1 Putative peptidoglycan binding domain-containing protein [Amycolatopsis arida]